MADLTPCPLGGEITFREYAPCDNPSTRPAVFAAREALRDVLAGGWLKVACDDAGEPQVVASHFVGLIPFRCRPADAPGCPEGGDHLILIRPKGDRAEDLSGLMRFLDLALLEPPQQTGPGLTARRGPHHCVVLARHYAEVLRQLCRRDFRRDYRQEEGELAGRIRGRLYVAGQMRNRLRGRAHRAPCRWEEFTADNWDNRILLGAARALERAARDIGSEAAAATVRAEFRPVEPWFAEVEEVPVHPWDLRKARLGRMSVHYRRALDWARLLLQGMNRPAGGGPARGLLVDANRAFQALAEATARSAASLLSGIGLSAEGQASIPSLVAGKPDRRADLAFRAAGTVVAVGDAKYKDVLALAQQGDVQLDQPSGYAERIVAADWNQIYVYLRLARAAKGFFVVPYWSNSARPAELFTAPAFTRGPLDGGAAAQVKILALNLLRPIGAVRREGARLLARWLDPVEA